MSSGSLKDLSRAINTSSAALTLPLPEDLLDVINAYVEKHAIYDDSDEKRLQEELINIYQTSVVEHPSRLAPFLSILRLLKPAFRAPGRLLQWWDKLSPPIMVHLGVEKGLASEVKNTLLSILVYDEDEEDSVRETARATSVSMVENLISTWLAKIKLASEEFDDHAKFVEGQIQLILLAFGKKRPKDFLTAINKFFVKKDSRILALSLLCEFFRHQPPHLHLLLQTPLFENLLRCLQTDTSTRAISLAMTALVMFLPHIPIASSKHLPSLFNIYSRMLFWDRERRAVHSQSQGDDDENSARSGNGMKPWDKLPYLLESEDENVPELLHYFTFLYGLYPINFMSYIRKPQRYLRHAGFPGAEDLDVEPAEIRQRSEPFRQVHLLHPNFFHLTIESELTDNERWRNSEAADVVTECMALYVPSEDGHEHAARRRAPVKNSDMNSDIPDHPLLERELATPYQSRHTSWRNTASTAVASPEGYRASALHRKLSQTSQSMPSIADSPSLRPSNHIESPTIPPQMIGSATNNQLADMLNAQKSARGSLYQSLTNDSVASLALSNVMQDGTQVDAYLASLSRDAAPRSPSLRPTTTVPAEASLKVAYLNREIQLLKNDLNFERYLKQQHLSHIGQLRRKQIREARVEAETQNLINSSRGLKSKLEEAKRLNTQMKKETEKSKTHSRKWESDLTTKLRILREEQKKWNVERDQLKKDLNTALDNVKSLRQLVVTSERNELAAKQKIASVESSLDELDRLRTEVERLTARIRSYEAAERDALRAKENEEAALMKIELLRMELRSRDDELEKTKIAFEQERYAVQPARTSHDENQNESVSRRAALAQEVIDQALASSRNRITDLKKAHNHLLQRYNSLQSAYTDVREQLQQATHGDTPLIGGISGHQPPSSAGNPSPAQRAGGLSHPRRKHSTSDPERFDYGVVSAPPTGPLPPIPSKLGKLDTSSRSNSSTPTGGRSPVSGGSGQPQFFQAPKPFSPSAPGSSGAVSGSGNGSTSGGSSHDQVHDGRSDTKPKVMPKSDNRIYGRGGVQNIGKKEKDRENKLEERKGKDDNGGPKNEKKGAAGIRGLRGFG